MPQDGGADTPIPREGATPEASCVCPDALTLAAYLDGTMTHGERETLESHLAKCRKCAQAVAELRDIMDAVAREPVDPAEVQSLADRAKKIIPD